MILDDLETLLRQRKTDQPEGSYSATLLADPERAARKICEEAVELGFELVRTTVDHRRVTEEAADVVFHVLTGLVAAGVGWDEVLAELEARRR